MKWKRRWESPFRHLACTLTIEERDSKEEKVGNFRHRIRVFTRI